MVEALTESLCARCGRCCRNKLVASGRVHWLDSSCKFLDPDTKLCTVYAERHARNPRCLDAVSAAACGALPPDCPVARFVREYAEESLKEDARTEANNKA